MTTTRWLLRPKNVWVLVEVINGKQMPVGVGQVFKANDQYCGQLFGSHNPSYFNTLEEAKTWMEVICRMTRGKNS